MSSPTNPPAPPPSSGAQRVFAAIQTRTRLVVATVVALTALLVPSFLLLAPTESASTEPSGAVFDARDHIDERFVSAVFPTGFIAEPTEGDALRAEPLYQLLQAQQNLRDDPTLGPTLYTFYSIEADQEVVGLLSLADLVDQELKATGREQGLAEANDAEVKTAGAALIERYGADGDPLGLSTESVQTTRANGKFPPSFFPSRPTTKSLT